MGKGGEDLKILAQNIRDQSPALSTLLVSKMGCLRQCESGPMAALYPRGCWFADMSVPLTIRLLDQLKDGKQPLPENVLFDLGDLANKP